MAELADALDLGSSAARCGGSSPPFRICDLKMNRKTKKINLNNYKLLIFDIDGTLYDQKKLRIRMLIDIALYYFIRPFKIYELKILKIFREEREKRKGYSSDNLNDEQYMWVVEKTKYSIDTVKNVIEKWIFSRPLKYLLKYKYKGLDKLFLHLKNNNIKIGIYSDYPTKTKMEYLKLKSDIEIASTDKEINALKPDSKGLFYIINELGIKVDNSLFIGDRESTDGKCGKNAGMDYLIIDKKGKIFEELIR